MSEMYRFVTDWTLNAPIERVWEKILDVEAYPSLWPGVRRATIRGPESKVQLGSVVDYALKGHLPVLLRFSTEVTAFEPPTLVEFKVMTIARGILESSLHGQAGPTRSRILAISG